VRALQFCDTGLALVDHRSRVALVDALPAVRVPRKLAVLAAPRPCLWPQSTACRNFPPTSLSFSTKCRFSSASARRRARDFAPSNSRSRTTFPKTEIAARLAEHRLDCVLINAPPGDLGAGERGIASLPGRERDFAASMETALRYAKALGCPRIHVMSGSCRATADREEQAIRRETLVRNLRAACANAREGDVTLLVEALNPRDAPDYLFSTQAEAHAIRGEVGAANLKVQMDFYHTQIVEGDIATKLERWLPHIGHIQIAGVPGRHEPDVGEINYAWLLRRWTNSAYDGWVGCEYRPLRDTVSGLGWRADWWFRGPSQGEREVLMRIHCLRTVLALALTARPHDRTTSWPSGKIIPPPA
jgi:hydroxypyruvate isomerase